jgi:hypothetical protein
MKAANTAPRIRIANSSPTTYQPPEPMTTMKDEYNKGFDNGQMTFLTPNHITQSEWESLIRGNEIKAAMPHESPLVAAYWSGWKAGRNAIPVCG